MKTHFRRPTKFMLMILTGSVFVLFGLGSWQVQRLTWKEAIIDRIEHANQSAPMAELPTTLEELKEKEFYHVQLHGHYLPQYEFHLAARYFQNQLGYSIFTPFQLTDERVVLVNRGWVPAKLKETAVRPAEDLSGERTITAQIRTSDERNYFTPPNRPDVNVWFGRDTAAMGKSVDLDLEPLTLDLIGEQRPNIIPVPGNGIITLRNDHLGYAITWFALAFALIVIGIMYHREKTGLA